MQASKSTGCDVTCSHRSQLCLMAPQHNAASVLLPSFLTLRVWPLISGVTFKWLTPRPGLLSGWVDRCPSLCFTSLGWCQRFSSGTICPLR